MRLNRHAVRVLALTGALACAAPGGALADDPASETDHWWGGMGAVMCGVGLREFTYVVANPVLLGVTIGGCALAAIDCLD